MNSMIERLTVGVDAPGLKKTDRPIGRILEEAGELKPADAERTALLQQEQGLRFGEACIKLGLVSQQDIDSALAYQFDYPYLPAGDTDLSDEVVAAHDPFSTQVEALRVLRTELLLKWFNANRRVLAIVSPSRRDGRSYLAANLAVVFSQLGERTLLIDADMRAARQHKLFKLTNQYGLSALLSGRVNGIAIERVRHFAALSVLPAGGMPPNPLELVSRPEFKDLLALEEPNFDVILIDTPAAERSSDAQAVAARAGGALMVVRENASRVDAVGRLTAAIKSTNAEVVGCVVNRF